MRMVEKTMIPLAILMAGIIVLVTALNAPEPQRQKEETPREEVKRMPATPSSGWNPSSSKNKTWYERNRTTGEELEPELFPELKKKEKKNFH